MKRSIRIAIASAGIAAVGVVVGAPAALASAPSLGSVCVNDVCSTDTSAPTVTSADVAALLALLKVECTGANPGSICTFYFAHITTQSPVRAALLSHTAHTSVLASARTSVLGAVPANAVFLGAFTANAQGVASGEVKLPASLPLGAGEIVATGTSSSGAAFTETTPITIVAAASSSSAGLPFTGSDSIIPFTLAGAAALAVGSGLVVVARRRRVTTSEISA